MVEPTANTDDDHIDVKIEEIPIEIVAKQENDPRDGIYTENVSGLPNKRGMEIDEHTIDFINGIFASEDEKHLKAHKNLRS